MTASSSRAQARADRAQQERDIIAWSRRLAAGSFTGTPFAGRVMWPTAADLEQHRPWQIDGEEGFLIPAFVFVSHQQIAAARKAAIKHVRERRREA